MDEIPEDVMNAAEAALWAIDIYGTGDDGGSEIYEHLVKQAIAYAIAAERKRCAAKARLYGKGKQGIAASEAIANAIESGQ